MGILYVFVSEFSMAQSIALLPLNSGASIPQFGFGTYKLTGQDAYDGVRDALEL